MIVNRFQYRLMAGNFLYLTAMALAFLVVLFAPLVALLADGEISVGQREIAAHQMLGLHERILFALPMLIGLCLLHSILVSHRIAGPLHRLKRVFADIAGGDLSMQVRVRRHDYLGEEAELVAEMVKRLGDRVEAIRDGHREAGSTLPRLMDAVNRGAHEEAQVLAGQLGTQLDHVGEQIRQLRVRRGDGARPEESRAPVAELVTSA